MTESEFEKQFNGLIFLAGILMIAVFIAGLIMVALIPDQHTNGLEPECDFDESLCVLGIPDPDFLELDNDTGE